MKRFMYIALSLLLTLNLLSGCGESDRNIQAGSIDANNSKEVGTGGSENSVDTAKLTEEYFSKSDADMFTDRDSAGDYDKENSIMIQLNGTSAVASSDSVKISGSTITITENATYIISGTLDDGMIIVNAEDTAKLQLVLDGVNINSKTSAPLYILEADKVFVTLADNTDNTLSNGGTFNSVDDSNIDSVIFSRQDITFNGSGTLNVISPAGHGIVSKDDLVITDGEYYVNCASHGIDANDSVRITGNTTITVNAGKDGIHAENNDDSSLGFVYISNGSIKIEAEDDGISAGAYMQIEGGAIDIIAGGGSKNGTKEISDSNDSSMKGLKAVAPILISSGTINIDSADDAIHSNASVMINGGTFELASGDDGVHGDESLTITDGNINITDSYEGLEAQSIDIMGGDISLTAKDDGINAAGGRDSSGITGGRDGMRGNRDSMYGDRDGMPDGKKTIPGGRGGMSSSNGTMSISGGNIYIKMGGDGLDSNGSMSVSGGTITVSGANSGDTSIIDYDSEGIISGGVFVGTGASGMAQNFSSASTQGTIMAATGSQPAGTEIKLTDSDGSVVVSHTAEREFSCMIISHSSIVNGQTYKLTAGSYESDVTMDSTVYGSGNSGGMGGKKGGRMDGNWNGGRDDRMDGSGRSGGTDV
ncbi:MAG: carbohydrate-binding domain-containing protein [Lachnospiraceae bacterium]|nr:carbohydrate-binding domain-containing protein [Lachnospiraceae bacterium]